MKISKEYKWEMSHRLRYHKGLCKNIHGHTYRMAVILTGTPLEETEMILDYYDIGLTVKPLLEQLDHAMMVAESDTVMIDFLKKNNLKMYIIQNEPTAENICELLIGLLAPKFKKYGNISRFGIRIYETQGTYAEDEIVFYED